MARLVIEEVSFTEAGVKGMAVLEAEPLPENAARALLAQANDAGGPDNITVLIARFDAQE